MDQGHRLLELRAGGGGGVEREFSGRDEVSLRPIPEGLGVTKRKNKRDQDHGLLTGFGEPPTPC